MQIEKIKSIDPENDLGDSLMMKKDSKNISKERSPHTKFSGPKIFAIRL